MEAGQLRFWSLCTGESRVTVRTPDCVADRELPVDSARRFTVVVSRREDRPVNASERCGVSWIDWGDRGDGAGDPDYAVLILRNMLPAADFGQAVQRVQRPGTEPDVMGAHFPATGYGTKAGFERRGCSPSALFLGRRLRSLRRGRRVRVRAACESYEATCSGRLTMRWGRRLVGRARFRVRSGRNEAITFRLSRKGPQALPPRAPRGREGRGHDTGGRARLGPGSLSPQAAPLTWSPSSRPHPHPRRPPRSCCSAPPSARGSALFGGRPLAIRLRFRASAPLDLKVHVRTPGGKVMRALA